MRLAHESSTPLDEDEGHNDLVLNRQNVPAIDDVKMGPDGGAEGGVRTVGR